MVFYTSNLFLGNQDIALRRHFHDANAMNNRIIENWNSVVTSSDKVYILGGVGDFEFLLSLNGEKTVLMSDFETDTYNKYVASMTTDLEDSFNKEMFESYLVSSFYIDRLVFNKSIVNKDYTGRMLRLTTESKTLGRDFTIFGGSNEYQRAVIGGVNSNIYVNGMFPLSEIEVEDIIKHSNSLI